MFEYGFTKDDLEIDYLQVFELRARHGNPQIIHRQDESEGRDKWIFQLKHTNTSIKEDLVVGSNEYRMMLLSNDYQEVI